MHKLIKIILMKILWNFQGDFWKNLQSITEISKEKLQRSHKEILEIFGALLKIHPGRFKALSGTENTANIFQNNILLLSPLTTYSMKTMIASLLAFLQRVYIKNIIDKYRYKKIFDTPITTFIGIIFKYNLYFCSVQSLNLLFHSSRYIIIF